MNHPGKTECDLCHNEIPSGVKHAAIAVPLTKDDRAELMREVERMMPQAPPHNIFGAMMTPENMTPNVWQFEVCMDCIYGILPMLRKLKTEQIAHILRRKAEARERAQRQEEQEQDA